MVIEAWALADCDATPTSKLHQNKTLCVLSSEETKHESPQWHQSDSSRVYRHQKSRPNDTLNRAIIEFYDRRLI